MGLSVQGSDFFFNLKNALEKNDLLCKGLQLQFLLVRLLAMIHN